MGEEVLRVVQAGLGALSCVFVYKATQRLAGDRTAAWAGALMALYPPFVMYTRVLQAEMLFVALFTAAVWVTLEFLAAPTVWRSALMGLLWVTSLLTRPDGSIFAVVAGLYVLAALTVRHGRAVVRVLPALAPAVAIVTLLWGSWIVRNYQLHGVLMPMVSTTGTGLWSANYLRYQRAHNPDRYPAGVLPELIDVPGYPAMSEVERDAALGRLGSQFIREHPATFAYYGLTRLNVIFPLLPRRAEFQPVEADGPYVTNNPTALVEFPLYNTPLERLRVWTFRLLFVCAVAACVGAWRRRDVRLVLAMLMILTLPARMVAYQGGERARLMIDPFIIVLAAGFLAERSARRETAAQPTLVQAPAQQG